MDTTYRIEFKVFKEDGVYIAYCPSLDISTCAETRSGAISAFAEAFQIYVDYCIEHGTLPGEL